MSLPCGRRGSRMGARTLETWHNSGLGKNGGKDFRFWHISLPKDQLTKLWEKGVVIVIFEEHSRQQSVWFYFATLMAMFVCPEQVWSGELCCARLANCLHTLFLGKALADSLETRR